MAVKGDAVDAVGAVTQDGQGVVQVNVHWTEALAKTFVLVPPPPAPPPPQLLAQLKYYCWLQCNTNHYEHYEAL